MADIAMGCGYFERCLSYERDSEILADLPGELVVDLSMTRDRRTSVLFRVAPP
jgi:hypothetical protein